MTPSPILAAPPWHWWLGLFWLIVNVTLVIGLGILYYRMVVAPTRRRQRSDVVLGRSATVGAGGLASDDAQAIARGLQSLDASIERVRAEIRGLHEQLGRSADSARAGRIADETEGLLTELDRQRDDDDSPRRRPLLTVDGDQVA